MNKSDLIEEAMRRGGFTRNKASRGVDATLEIMKRELSSDGLIQIRGLGRLLLKPKRKGFLPASPRPIPAGKSVRLKAARSAVAILRSEPLKLDNNASEFGGIMDKKERDSQNEAVAVEGSALGLDVGTSRLVLASGGADRIRARSELNAFIAVPFSRFTENILKQNKVNYQLNGGTTIQVFGNEAAQFANVFNAEVRRPMMVGTLNPSEE